MREFVGVKNLLDIICASHYEPGRLKRELLLFDRIAVTHYKLCISELRKRRKNLLPDYLNQLEWLFEKGIVFEPEFSQSNEMGAADEEYKSYSDKATGHLNLIGDLTKGLSSKSREYEEILVVNGAYAVQCHTRMAGIHLRKLDNLEAVPVFFMPILVPPLENQHNKQRVVHISFKALPIPDESTPWERVVEFRNDPDSKSKFLALRHWMSEVARAELTPAEVEEKLEYLLDQYQRHMKLHKMKTNVGTLETIITTGAEVLSDLVSFKWGKAAGALFSLKSRQVALLEGELTSPGKEVAYIVKARETFS